MSERGDLVGGIRLFAELTQAQRETVERLFFTVARNDGATIVAASGNVEMLAISGWNFSQLLAADRGIRDALEHAAAAHASGHAQEAL